jgi:hypothetical protein
MVTFR